MKNNLINSKNILEISELIKEHLYNYDNSLTFNEREFIADNIDDCFLFDEKAYRVFLFENEYEVDFSIEKNCSWSKSINGIKSLIQNYEPEFCWDLDKSQLWEGIIVGIDLNKLLFF